MAKKNETNEEFGIFSNIEEKKKKIDELIERNRRLPLLF